MARKSNNSGKNNQSKSRDELFWLETYFIMFPSSRRPTLSQVEHALAGADPRLQLENLAADDDGLFASLLVESPEDHAAVEVSYEMGDAVVEQNLEWAKQLQKQLSPKQLQQMLTADARLDVAHFERVEAGTLRKEPKSSPQGKPLTTPRRRPDDEDELADDAFDEDSMDDEIDEDAAMEIFDPTCMLTVLETLSQLTHGLAFDPAAGEVV
jgi:hypothetical protein